MEELEKGTKKGKEILIAGLLFAAAGYSGSMVWGVLIFIPASRMQRDRLIALSIGFFMRIEENGILRQFMV